MIKIDKNLLNETSDFAKKSERKRKNYNFHKIAEDTLQRMLNAIEPGTYVQPHKHENPDKREAFIILRGKALVIEFDNFGNISDYFILDYSTENVAVEISAKVYHTLISLSSNTIVYELKDGPYKVENDKNFAKWAPKEGDTSVNEYLKNLIEKIEILEKSEHK